MAVQTNRNFMSNLEFQKRFPNLYNQQAQQAQQGAFGASLGSGTPYQGLTNPVTSFGGETPPLDITSPFNFGMPGSPSTPSSLADSIYGNAGATPSALPGMAGNQTGQAAFGNIAQPLTQTGQAAFGNIAQPINQTGQAAFGSITQPTTIDNLAKEVAGQDGQKIVDPNNSGMTDEMIEQLQVAENARFQQVIREEEAKKRIAEEKVLAEKLAEEARKREEEAAEARLTPEQRLEKYTPKLQEQILGQKLTDKWSGQGKGSAEANAKDMARIMSSIGITDIRQFGKVPVYESVQEMGKTYNGSPVQIVPSYDDIETGRFVTQKEVPDPEGGFYYAYVDIPKDAKLETVYGLPFDNGDYGIGLERVDPSKIKTVNGKLVADTGKTTFGNKLTGQAVPNTYSERQTGNFFGGTFDGKGNTGYGVQFTPDGTPIFYTQGASSSDIGKIAPLLTMASFIPGLAPFAQGLNALIAAKQGNILGALAGFTGLGSQIPGLSGISGGLSNISNAANFAGAVKNKNILGMLSSGANLAGTDLSGLANSAGLGDVSSGLAGLNLGGLGVSDALKAYRTVQAVKSGDPSSIISALGGYAKDSFDKNQNAKGFASASNLSRSLAGRSQVPVEDRQFTLPSVDDDFASSYGLPRTKDDLSALLPGLPELPEFGSKDLSALLPEMPKFTETQNEPSESGNKVPNMSGRSFGSAFAEARTAGEKEFMWNGKAYNTNLASKEVASYDSVGGGRGGQGGSTAEQFARANAVRGNAPQTDVAKLVSSLFPSAEAGSLPANRGQDSASQITGQSSRAPASTYNQENSMVGRLADELGLPPELQRNISNTLNALPGLNMPVGALRGVNAASRAAGAADEVGAAKYASEATRMTADPTRMFKIIQDMPRDVFNTTAAQNALKAIAEGDNLAAFKALESNPWTLKALLKHAEKMGVQEVSPLPQLKLFNPPAYSKLVSGPNKGGYHKSTRKAGGGLASLKKRQLAKA